MGAGAGLAGDGGDSLAWLGQLQATVEQGPEERQRRSPDQWRLEGRATAAREGWLGRHRGARPSAFLQQVSSNAGFAASCSKGPLAVNSRVKVLGVHRKGKITAGERMPNQEGSRHFLWGTERSGLSLAQSRQGQEGAGQLHTRFLGLSGTLGLPGRLLGLRTPPSLTRAGGVGPSPSPITHPRPNSHNALTPRPS